MIATFVRRVIPAALAAAVIASCATETGAPAPDAPTSGALASETAPSAPSLKEPAPEKQASDAAHAESGLPESNQTLRINDAGLDIIKASEGLRLEAYTAGGRRYIGYGHQMAPGEPSRITEAEADRLLRLDVREAEDGVRRVLTVPVNENQFSAMVSLAYNLGTGGFARSQVPARLNNGDVAGAADAFLNHNRAFGRVLDHLTERREKERSLFLTPAS